MWYRETSRGFRFALKGSRFITHNKKLEGVEAPLANYFASGLLLLREKLGPIVWQLGPRLRFEPERLERFFRLLPQDTRSAARLARAHDHRLEGRSWTASIVRAGCGTRSKRATRAIGFRCWRPWRGAMASRWWCPIAATGRAYRGDLE